MARTKLRTPDLRDRVLEVAVVTLERQGVSGFTARTIAQEASTSVPAVYELFGDKGGLIREVFFEGFRRLGRQLEELAETDDPRGDLLRVTRVLRDFAHDHARLFEVMFSRPFSDFDPGPDELEAGRVVRELVIARVRRCVLDGSMVGDPNDVAHVVVALAQGLAAQEAAGWLGRSRVAIDRRWALAFEALVDGLSPLTS